MSFFKKAENAATELKKEETLTTLTADEPATTEAEPEKTEAAEEKAEEPGQTDAKQENSNDEIATKLDAMTDAIEKLAANVTELNEKMNSEVQKLAHFAKKGAGAEPVSGDVAAVDLSYEDAVAKRLEKIQL